VVQLRRAGSLRAARDERLALPIISSLEVRLLGFPISYLLEEEKIRSKDQNQVWEHVTSWK